MPNQQAQLSDVFHALADPTRRAVLERLGGRPMGMTELAEPFDMALPSFSQHLDVLEDCGLVRSEKQGRVRMFRLSPEPLTAAESWLGKQRKVWERRLDRLDSYLEELKKSEKKEPKK